MFVENILNRWLMNRYVFLLEKISNHHIISIILHTRGYKDDIKCEHFPDCILLLLNNIHTRGY